jgi:hypothetical protein
MLKLKFCISCLILITASSSFAAISVIKGSDPTTTDTQQSNVTPANMPTTMQQNNSAPITNGPSPAEQELLTSHMDQITDCYAKANANPQVVNGKPVIDKDAMFNCMKEVDPDLTLDKFNAQ